MPYPLAEVSSLARSAEVRTTPPSAHVLSTSISVPLKRIDDKDERFRLRVVDDFENLSESLQSDGQQTPVILWGDPNSLKVIDGFRRIAALKSMNAQSVLAIIRNDLDQTQAFSLSFLVNAQRKSLTPLDKAFAVRRALHEFEMGKPMLARVFRLSVRQIDRYIELLRFDQPIRDALQSHRISLGHASLLHRYRVTDVPEWVRRIRRDRLSSKELQIQLKRAGSARTRRSLVMRDTLGFRLAAIRYRWTMSESEKCQIRVALETALEMLSSGPTHDTSAPDQSPTVSW